MDAKKKTKRVTNAQLKTQVEKLREELKETQLHLMSVQETLIRLVKEWDSRMIHLRNSTEELSVRVNTITNSISNTVAPADA